MRGLMLAVPETWLVYFAVMLDLEQVKNHKMTVSIFQRVYLFTLKY